MYLFIQELPGVLLDVSLVQVCGETHETHFRQTEISEFNVTHGRDEQTDGERQTEIMWHSNTNAHSEAERQLWHVFNYITQSVQMKRFSLISHRKCLSPPSRWQMNPSNRLIECAGSFSKWNAHNSVLSTRRHLTCQVWDLDARFHSCECTRVPGRFQRSTCVPFPRAALRYSSAALRSRLLSHRKQKKHRGDRFNISAVS